MIVPVIFIVLAIIATMIVNHRSHGSIWAAEFAAIIHDEIEEVREH